MTVAEIIGLVGVVLMLAAYAGVMVDKIKSDTLLFHRLNLSGSLMVIYSLVHHWNLPTFLVEVAWSGVAAFGIFKVLINNKK